MNNTTRLFVTALLSIVGFTYSWTLCAILYAVWVVINIVITVQAKNKVANVNAKLINTLIDSSDQNAKIVRAARTKIDEKEQSNE